MFKNSLILSIRRILIVIGNTTAPTKINITPILFNFAHALLRKKDHTK